MIQNANLKALFKVKGFIIMIYNVNKLNIDGSRSLWLLMADLPLLLDRGKADLSSTVKADSHTFTTLAL
jgi:hypothetical protein